MPLALLCVAFCYLKVYHRADIVMTCGSGWLPSLITWLAFLTCKPLVKEIVLLGSDDPLTLAQRNSLIRPLLTLPFRFADLIVAISPPLAEACLQYGITREKIWCRLNPINFTAHLTETNHGKYPLERVEKERVPVVLWVGKFSLRKNISFLLDAAKHITQPVRLVFAGPHEDKSYYNMLLKKAQALPAHIEAVFLDEIRKRDELVALYKQADLFWFASKNEGMGNVVAEALVCGTPVVSLPVLGIMKNLFEEGKDGEIVKYEEPALFARAVQKWLSKTHDRRAIAARAKSRFAHEPVDAEYVRWFHTLSNRSKFERPLLGLKRSLT